MTEKKVYKPECCTGCTFADECFSDIRIKCGEYETAIKEYYRGLSEGLEEGCVKAKELEKVKAELEETLDAQDDKIDFYVSNMNEHILKNKDLEKENAELKEKLNGFENGEVVFIGHYEAVKCYPILKERFAELEAQIEKMKCCGNCANHSFLIPEIDRYVKGKNPEKCDDCKYYSLNDDEGNDNWELAE